MNKTTWLVIVVIVLMQLTGCAVKSEKQEPLKNALANKFYIGAAIDSMQIVGADTKGVKIIKEQFNCVTAENCMKSEKLQPSEGEFDFALADSFIHFAQANNMHIIGHCLIWHSQAPKWFFTDSLGNSVSREVMIERMKNHIQTVVTHFKGKVHGWDVVNEAIEDNGSWRQNRFYQIIGEEYVELAFRFAYEANPDVELYYNDYSMAHEGKRNAVVNLVNKLKEKGVKIDGIGMQCHTNMEFPTVEEFEKSIEAYAGTGSKVMITEMDLSVLPSPDNSVTADIAASAEYTEAMNPYPNGLPDSVATAQQNRYFDFFKLFLKHADQIDRVTMWGVHDAQSWRNNWPIFGRTDYPLLFDRKFEPKPVVQKIIEEAGKKL